MTGEVTSDAGSHLPSDGSILPSMSNEELLQAALALSLDERAKLARELIASLDDPPDADAQEAWALEIARRTREIQDGSVDGVSWTEAEKRVTERLRRVGPR
jgi:putative addiction module component (TIGR02574 family)